ncbi:MAG: hypothetical protein MJE77_33810 [Proteobacteria bacterium]|nr:hypothetical protein [Pseudomonadota bacterium]
MTAGSYHRIAGLISRWSGLEVRPGRETELKQALARTGQAPTPLDLLAVEADLPGNELVLAQLAESLVVPETYFLRDPEHFDFIRREILSGLRTRYPRHLSTWCAGCSSGEEAYSLAIILEQEKLDDRSTLVASDISRTALHKARLGLYSAWSLRGVEGDIAARYFSILDEHEFLITERIRKRPVFVWDNLAASADATPMGTHDLILCRNVLMYFTPTAIERVARRFYHSLNDGGWLVTGPSDPILDAIAPFKAVVTEEGTFYRTTRSPEPTVYPARGCLGTHVRPPDGRIVRPSGPTVPGQTVADPALVERRIAEARTALERGDNATALVLTRTLDESPKASGIYVRALANSDKPAEAEAALSRLLKRHASEVELHFLSAVLLCGQKQYDRAMVAGRQVVELDPFSVAGYLICAFIEHTLGNLRAALSSYIRARHLAESHPPGAVLPLIEDQTAGQLAAAAAAQIVHIEQKIRTGGDNASDGLGANQDATRRRDGTDPPSRDICRSGARTRGYAATRPCPCPPGSI